MYYATISQVFIFLHLQKRMWQQCGYSPRENGILRGASHLSNLSWLGNANRCSGASPFFALLLIHLAMFCFSCSFAYCHRLCCNEMQNVTWSFIGRKYKGWETNMSIMVFWNNHSKLQIQLSWNNVL
jgi:hypothetical protein